MDRVVSFVVSQNNGGKFEVHEAEIQISVKNVGIITAVLNK
jgi:hypothetical protein